MWVFLNEMVCPTFDYLLDLVTIIFKDSKMLHFNVTSLCYTKCLSS